MKLALKLLIRDWRGGELTLLLAALIIAVGTVTTITLFVDRLQQALLLESASFIAADRVISASRPIETALLARADEYNLQRSATVSFLSMVFSDERAQLAAVKAVDDGYPLRGQLISPMSLLVLVGLLAPGHSLVRFGWSPVCSRHSTPVPGHRWMWAR